MKTDEREERIKKARERFDSHPLNQRIVSINLSFSEWKKSCLKPKTAEN